MNEPSEYRYVDHPAAWEKCLRDLEAQDRLAIDIESNSMYVLHEEICLVQISTPEQDYIIDPLLNLNLSPLGEILADPQIEKIFHAAEYDLILMNRQFAWELNNLFDTMWAARILGYKKIGLANMLAELFNVKLDKRYQRTNWGERPLTASQLRYAQMDTHYLFQLRDQLARELDEGGYWPEARETFEQQSTVELPDDRFDPDRFWTMNGINKMPPRARAIAYALYLFRYELAEELNRPLFKIMGEELLLRLAIEAPRSMAHLGQIRGVSKWLLGRYGRELLRRIEAGRQGPIPKKPRPPRRPPQAALERYDALQQWRKERAQARGVESDVILSRTALWAIAEANPENPVELGSLSEIIGPWRTATYGPEILEILRNGANR